MLASVAIKLPGITLIPKPPCLVKWVSTAAVYRLEPRQNEDDENLSGIQVNIRKVELSYPL